MSVLGSLDFLKERIDELKGDIAQQRTDFEDKRKKDEEEMTKKTADLEKKDNALKEMITSQKRLEAVKVDMNKRVMELEGNADTWAEEKAVLTSEVKKYQGLFEREAEGTYSNIIEQVRFFNPSAKLENVHYYYYFKDG